MASVRGSPDPRVMRASRSNRVGGRDKDHTESLVDRARILWSGHPGHAALGENGVSGEGSAGSP
eukprot:6207981-Pleurochrysis_carterae.AAC.3